MAIDIIRFLRDRAVGSLLVLDCRSSCGRGGAPRGSSMSNAVFVKPQRRTSHQFSRIQSKGHVGDDCREFVDRRTRKCPSTINQLQPSHNSLAALSN